MNSRPAMPYRVLGILTLALAVALPAIVLSNRSSSSPTPQESANGGPLPVLSPALSAPSPMSQPAGGFSVPAARDDRSPERDAEDRAAFECVNSRTASASLDVGVSDTEVRLGTTVAASGLLASSLGDVRYAMEAAKNRINDAGGICGRRLSITYYDDGGDPERGAAQLCAMAKEVFAIAVVPSYPGLAAALKSGCINRERVPVVGTLGLTAAEFASPWVWSTGSSPAVLAGVLARDQYRNGARGFGIVFDNDEDLVFAEAARAYNAEVRRLTGSDIDGYNDQGVCTGHYCGVGGGPVGTSAATYNSEPVDVTTLALLPQTALSWMNDPSGPNARTRRYDGTLSLFNRAFANACQTKCNGMKVWTPYEPPLDDAGNAAQQYRRDLERTNANADPHNALVEGGYVGMMVIGEALAQVGVDLTRERLRRVLDTHTFRTGLTPPIHFGTSTRRISDRCLRGYEIAFKASFGGWKPRTDWECS